MVDQSGLKNFLCGLLDLSSDGFDDPESEMQLMEKVRETIQRQKVF